MKLYGGIDLHSNNSMVVLLDEYDKVVYEKRLPNDNTKVPDTFFPRDATWLFPDPGK